MHGQPFLSATLRCRVWPVPLALPGMAGVAAVAWGMALSPAGAAAGGALFALVCVLAAGAFRDGHPHPRPGPANAVTLLRAAAACLVAAAALSPAALADPARAWGLAGAAALALALDGADGWLARRTGLASDFGARFDMETDALMAAALASAALAAGKAGVWVLALGFMRYGFAAAMRVWPWLGAPLPPRPGRKTACVIQIAVLTALLAPPLVPPVSTLLGLAALLVLGLSFAADVLWLMRRR